MFKKLFILLLTVSYLLLSSPNIDASEKYYISINDELIDFTTPPLIVQGNIVYAPFQKTIQLLGGVTTVSHDKTQITAKIGDYVLYVDKVTKTAAQDWDLLKADELTVFNNISYISLPYITSLNGYMLQKVDNYPLYRLNTTTNLLPTDEYIAKMKPYMQLKPTVYLTFDDGPNQYTTQNIATLQQYDTQATFFFVGYALSKQQNIVKATFEAGHTIGLHSMTHDKKKLYASATSFINEMLTEQTLLATITGESTSIVRTPYGSVPWITPSMRNNLVQNNFKLWDWDVDTLDWKYDSGSYKKIIENVQKGVQQAKKNNDEHIIVLLHDRQATALALPEIAKWLLTEGYTLAPYNPDDHIVQNFLRDAEL